MVSFNTIYSLTFIRKWMDLRFMFVSILFQGIYTYIGRYCKVPINTFSHSFKYKPYYISDRLSTLSTYMNYVHPWTQIEYRYGSHSVGWPNSRLLQATTWSLPRAPPPPPHQDWPLGWPVGGLEWPVGAGQMNGRWAEGKDQAALV